MREKSQDTVHDVTRLLLEAQNGDRSALDRLLPLVYAQLRAVAARQLRSEQMGESPQPTALVHEAYMLLVDQSVAPWQSRAHFFGIAAHLVRQILVDNARRRKSGALAGDLAPVTMNEREKRNAEVEMDVVALDGALEALARKDARLARVVELRYFGGLSLPAMAEVLKSGTPTISKEWRAARAWLHRYLKDSTKTLVEAPAPKKRARRAAPRASVAQ